MFFFFLLIVHTPRSTRTDTRFPYSALFRALGEMPAPDRIRRSTHMLVDAGARDFTWVDPTPSKIIETPPAISFTVSTAKFEGRVTILYDRGGDTYVVELHRQNGESVEQIGRA